jgi:cellulose synthase/poly-beta-1,6-N-acetylglucosamine synthase-like glycosyltransferase
VTWDASSIFALLPVVLVIVGTAPTVTLLAQFLAVGLHRFAPHHRHCADLTPRVAFILPAWNEADVLDHSIEMLMRISYPLGAWRIYVVDDASTDDTPAVLAAAAKRYPGSVFHLRRDAGGQGKAHTLNHGLRHILSDDWAEAVMIMDADVLFEPLTLRRMTRYLADPAVGAVTAYVKEGSDPGNFVTRSIAFEYVTAQAAARRAQNMLRTLTCMAGGAQLHTRANLIDIGGAIDTSTLAEDTCTTIQTQLLRRKAIFASTALVWAEEPDSLAALWKQRLRWARGNLQLTANFRHLWFHPRRFPGLGGFAFGAIWFSVVLMPFFVVLGSLGLIGIYLTDANAAWTGFRAVWSFTLAAYLFETLFAFAIDPETAKRSWLQGLLYPGLVSLSLMALGLLPNGIEAIRGFEPLVYGWGALSIAAGWAVYRLDKAGLRGWPRNLLLMLVGYGSVLAAVAIAAFFAEWRGLELKWDKTVKSGKARILK